MDFNTKEKINKLDHNGLRHGNWLIMFDNENVSCEGNYSHGAMVGRWIDYNTYSTSLIKPRSYLYFENSIEEGEHVNITH